MSRLKKKKKFKGTRYVANVLRNISKKNIQTTHQLYQKLEK
jgi:hypothetical protein